MTIRIKQICNGATSINITSITYPNTSVAETDIEMNDASNGEFYYNFGLTNQLGRYDVSGIANGCENTFTTYFEVTPSGNSNSNANIAFFIIIILLIYGIAGFGLYTRNVTFTILGGMALLILGVYMFNNGIIIFRDDITRVVSYITMGIGTVLAVWASYEWFKDM